MTPRRPIFSRHPLLILAVLVLSSMGLQAAEGKRPNVLFAIADDWGWPHAGAYGYEWVKTPNFDRIAREGVLFKHAFTNNPKCTPCRASILTGRNSWQNEEGMVHFSLMPKKWPVYPDLLEADGYHIGLTGKGWGPGDFKSTGWTRNPAGPSYDKNKLEPPASGMGRNDYAANFEAFLTERKPGQPFCFWYGASEPHRGYEQGSGARAGKKPGAVNLPPYYPNSPVIRNDFLDYALEAEWFDQHLGRMIAKLEAAGELENTIIIVTSDHGAPFPRMKGHIYEDGFHIPLAVRFGSKVMAGRTVEDFINVRDFAPTILELCGTAVPESITGKSFAPVLLSDKDGYFDTDRNRMVIGKERHDVGRPNDAGYPVRAIRTPDWLYVRNYEPSAGPPETRRPATARRMMDRPSSFCSRTLIGTISSASANAPPRNFTISGGIRDVSRTSPPLKNTPRPSNRCVRRWNNRLPRTVIPACQAKATCLIPIRMSAAASIGSRLG